MTPMRVAILGAAGQARETAWYLHEINRPKAASPSASPASS
jgi:hypothetical protein